MPQLRASAGFQPEAVAATFTSTVLDATLCRHRILRRLHPNGPTCPDCGSLLQGERPIASFWAGQRVACADCNKYYTARTGTILAGSSMDYRDIYLLLVLLGFQLPIRTIALAIGVHVDTVRQWRERLNLLASGSTS